MDSNQIGIELPRNIEAEQAVLGAILLEAEIIELVREHLEGNEFYSKSHEKIFRCMSALYESEIPIDLVMLVSRLQDNEELDDIGGVMYLDELAKSVPTAANILHYVGLVQEKHKLRQLIKANMELCQEAATSGNPDLLITKMQTKADYFSDQAAPSKEFSPIGDVLVESFDEIEKSFMNKDLFGGITGVPTGFDELDRMTSGFQSSDLIIVAARPSVGKTAFALNIATNAAKKIENTVAVFSLEMSKTQLGKRMISAESNVDAGRIKTGFLQGDDWEKLSMAIGTLSETKIFIDDSAALTAIDIRAKCRRLKKEHGLGLIVIDYLQLISGRGKRGENRQQEVSEISRTLKQIARELEVPVIALSQLSRGVEQRQDKRPMMSDLRESGAIEQDADIVAFLYRDDYYDKESEKKNIIEIIISKQRNGPVGTVELVFLKNFNKFVNLDRSHGEGFSNSQPASRGPNMEARYGA
jgi:replicative DNA helicase